MKLSFQYIGQKLRETYPDSRRIRPGFVGEILDTFERYHWSADQFDSALLRFREQDVHYQFPPDFRQLARYVPRAATPAGAMGGQLAQLFFNAVVNHGWAEAVRCGLAGQLGGDAQQAQQLRDWLAEQGIDADTEEFFRLDDWQRLFCVLLHHERNPAAAYTYAAANAPEPLRGFYQLRCEKLSRLPLDQTCRYFTVLR